MKSAPRVVVSASADIVLPKLASNMGVMCEITNFVRKLSEVVFFDFLVYQCAQFSCISALRDSSCILMCRHITKAQEFFNSFDFS